MVVRDKGSDSGLVTIYRERESAQSSPRSVTEFYGGIVFFPLYQARKYVLTSWYCNSFCPRVVNPSSGLGGLEGRQKMSVILSVRGL